MIGKQTFTINDEVVGKITKIIDQPDTHQDDLEVVCDIDKDLFQVVVQISPEVYPILKEPTEILFSSQTLNKVVPNGIQLKLTKEIIEKHIETSMVNR